MVFTRHTTWKEKRWKMRIFESISRTLLQAMAKETEQGFIREKEQQDETVNNEGIKVGLERERLIKKIRLAPG